MYKNCSNDLVFVWINKFNDKNETRECTSNAPGTLEENKMLFKIMFDWSGTTHNGPVITRM